MATEEKWREIGSLTKSIKRDLNRLVLMSSDAGMRKPERESLRRAIKHFDQYRSAAEDCMFQKTDIEDVTVFYGGGDE